MKKIFNLLINGLLSMVLLSSCANSNSSLTSKNKTPVSSESVISNSSSSNDKITSSSSIVVDKVVSISLNYNDNIKYDYFLNEELDLENVTINVIYESKETKIINVTKDMIKLMDISINQETNMNSVGYKMVIISYEGQEVSYLIHVIDKDAPFDKIDPAVKFNFEAGAVFSLSSTDRPMVTISEGADYTTHFSCEAKQLKGETYIFNTFEELEPGYNYSLVVSIKENDLFNADEKWCWFKLVE